MARKSLLVFTVSLVVAALGGSVFVGSARPGDARSGGVGAATRFTRVTKIHQLPGTLVAWVRPGRRVAIHSRPGGRIVAWAAARTEFGSRQALAVVRSRGTTWLAVKSVALPNSRAGWIRATPASLRYSHSPVAISVDLSRRLLTVLRGSHVLRRITVAIGRPGSTTPVGRFAITDKLSGPTYGRYFGCCILALSGHQPNVPRDWTGGNRLAIHGTPSADFGRASSAGCLHAPTSALEYLMRVAPLGTQVVIHP